MILQTRNTLVAIALCAAALCAVPSHAQQGNGPGQGQGGGGMAALEARVSNLEQEVDTLAQQMTNAQGQLDALAANDAAQLQTLQTLSQQLTSVQGQLTAAQGELDALKATDQSLAQQLTAAQTQLNALKTSADGMQAQLDALKATDTNLQAQVDALKAADANTQTQVDALKATDASTQAQMDALKASDANTQTQLGALKAADTNLQTQVDAINANAVGFYRRDGSEPLTGALAGGGQDANNLNNINAGGSVNAGALNTATANVTTLNATNIIPAQTVAENSACDSVTQGYFAKDGNNVLLACQSGVWVKLDASSALVQAQLDALKTNVDAQFANVATQFAATASQAQLDALKASIDGQFAGLNAQLANAVTQAQLDAVKANIAAQFANTASQLAAMQLQLDGIKPLDFYRRDGTLPLTAALAGGGQDANDLNNINASGTVTAANAALTGSLSAAAANVSGTADVLTLKATNIMPMQTVAENSACDPATQGYFAKDNAGVLLSCQSGAWAKVGGSADVQAQLDALKATDTNLQSNVGTLNTTTANLQSNVNTLNTTTTNLQSQVNSVASNETLAYRRDGSRPLTGALAGGGQDANNLKNINASGSISAGSASLTGALSAASVNATTVNATASGNGALNADKANILNFNPTLTAVENTSCIGQGFFAKTSAGALLTCQSGVWARLGSSNVQSQLDALKATDSGLQSQINSLGSVDAGLQSQVNSLKATDSSLQSQLTNLQNTQSSQQSQLNGLSTEVNRLSARYVHTIARDVNLICSAGDSAVQDYNYPTWALTCGTRFCRNLTYTFGIVIEHNLTNTNSPFLSANNNAAVVVVCTR